MSGKPAKAIALEEHYVDPEVLEYLGEDGGTFLNLKMAEIGPQRLDDMDRHGVLLQVLSHAPPGQQRVRKADAPGMAQRVNDRLRRAIDVAPDRFAAFAALPTADPDAAAEELRRAVRQLGFKGAMIHGLTGGLFLDDPSFDPIFSAAVELDVPLYIHPADPEPAIMKAYFGDYAVTHPMFTRAAWGFTIETGTQAIRMVLGGVFERHPTLRVILGHLGETIPYLLARIDEALSRDTPMTNFREVFCQHFYVTTSGFFSDPAFLCCAQELGVDRILFSVDWPFASNQAGTEWVGRLAMCEEDRAKVLSGNARRLLRLHGPI